MSLTLDPSTLKALRKRQAEFRSTVSGLQSQEVKSAQLIHRWRLAKPHVHGRDLTAPFDARFASTQDKMKACWSLFNEHLRCVKSKDEDAPECQQLQRWSVGLCPTDLTKTWMAEREAGNFAGVKVNWTPRQPAEAVSDDAADEDDGSTSNTEDSAKEEELSDVKNEEDSSAAAEASVPRAAKKADKAARKSGSKKGKVAKKAKDTKRKLKGKAANSNKDKHTSED